MTGSDDPARHARAPGAVPPMTTIAAASTALAAAAIAGTAIASRAVLIAGVTFASAAAAIWAWIARYWRGRYDKELDAIATEAWTRPLLEGAMARVIREQDRAAGDAP